MAANLSTAIAAGNYGTVPDGSGLVKEEIVITGAASAVGDTGTWTAYMKQPLRAEAGPCSYSISGQVVTFTDKAGIGTTTVGATVYGYQ